MHEPRSRHGKHIGPLSSAGRNALPVSRFHACFPGRGWHVPGVRAIAFAPSQTNHSHEGRGCASQTCTAGRNRRISP
jgi:hypothetical protein